MDNDEFYAQLEELRDYDRPAILGDFWIGELLDQSYTNEFAVYVLENTSCNEFNLFLDNMNMFVLTVDD